MTALTPPAEQLATDMRDCPDCVIAPGVGAFLCVPHSDRLDELVPERCSDPDCYACPGGAR